MPNWNHGGDIYTAGGIPQNLLDFSASLNPMGMPPAVQAAAREGIAAAAHYPDPQCRALRQSIAQAEGVPEAYLLCGNGAAELLDRLALALKPRRSMLLAPSFGEYERALRAVGSKVLYHYLKPEQGFDLTEDLLRVLRPGLDLLILCNPNNPTGRAIPSQLLLELLARCRQLKTVLVVDESFLPLADEEAGTDLRPYLASNPQLVLLRSLTKSYCMPGLRLGYLLSSNLGLLEKLALSGQPWSVSTPAQYAGAAAVRYHDWPKRGRELVRPQRLWLANQLESLGFQVWESAVNYLLFYAPGQLDLRERLLESGILIRSCANFVGLGEGYYRVAVRTAEENAALIRALSALVPEGRG